jgi:hypothetical protein
MFIILIASICILVLKNSYMNLIPTLNNFSQMFSQRLAFRGRVKEDDMRYTFFNAALNTNGLSHLDIALEVPPQILGHEVKEIDMLIESNQTDYLLEFKYDQAGPGGNQNNARTQRMGKLINDFLKLNASQAGHQQKKYKAVLYATDCIMDQYLINGDFGFYHENHPFVLDNNWLGELPQTARNGIPVDYYGLAPEGIIINRVFTARPWRQQNEPAEQSLTISLFHIDII